MVNGKRIGHKYHKLWTNIRHQISRCFDVITRIDEDCPNCYYSQAENASSGKYKSGGPEPFVHGRCPVCKGEGVLSTTRTTTIRGDIVWKGRASAVAKEGLMTFFTPGEEDMVIARVKVDLCHKSLITSADYFIIDKAHCVLVKPPSEAGIQRTSSLTFYVKTRDKFDEH